MIRSAMWLALGLMMACTDPAFEGRIVELEAEVAALESEVAQLEQGPAKRAGPSNEQEEAAGVLAREIQAISQGQGEPARGKEACEELSKYPGTRGHGAMGRLCEEFAVVGAEAGELEVTQWYAGSADMNNGEATLLVFWELWCPHCRREVPKLQELHAQYAARGLNVIGLTQEIGRAHV